MAETIKSILATLQGLGPVSYETESAKAGCTIRRAFRVGSRHVVDRAPDFEAEGWQQFDTSEDADHFGIWLNPRHRVVLTFADGYWTLESCPSAEHYREAVGRLCKYFDAGRSPRMLGADGILTDAEQEQSDLYVDSLLADALRRVVPPTDAELAASFDKAMKSLDDKDRPHGGYSDGA